MKASIVKVEKQKVVIIVKTLYCFNFIKSNMKKRIFI